MELSLSVVIQVLSVRCELDLYIHPSNDRGSRLFYLLT